MSSVASDDADLEIPPFPVRRWSVAEYELFARLGILDEDDRLELLDGWIVPKMTKNPLHDGTVDEIARRLSALVPVGWYLRIQNVLLTPDSAPEPDLVVVRGVPRDYLRRHPTGADVALVVEVSDSSVERDRIKARVYTRAGVPEYWLVNLIDNEIEIYSEIIGSGRDAKYDHESSARTGDRISFTIPDRDIVELSATDLLP